MIMNLLANPLLGSQSKAFVVLETNKTIPASRRD